VRSAALALSVGLLVSGCHPSEERERVVLRDGAELCVGVPTGDAGVAGPVDLPRDKPLSVVVRTGCLSACAKERKAKCSVKRELDKLVVSSELSWTLPYDLAHCVGACSALEATCQAEAVPGTKVTFVHGKTSVTLDAPAHLATGCLGAGAPAAVDASAPPSASVSAAASGAALATAPSGSGAAASSGAAAVAAPPTTGAPPTPKPSDGICALPYPGKAKGSATVIGITVTRPNPCEAASCGLLVKPKCTMKRQGNRLILKTDLPAPGAKPRQPCTEDCGSFLASCRSGPLPPGTYTIEHADQKLTVQLPLGKDTCTP
jgi:hypothetical protein